jgi:two-component system chemotaxis response regulator CheY
MSYNVLIVDDSIPMRGVIKKIIKASGFNVKDFFEASNGNEALKVLNEEWLDLVLTDYNMPEMDGLELLDEIKKSDASKSIPVVVVTTEGSKKKLVEFLEKGAMDYIRKPFTPEEIKEKLNQIMGEPQYEERVLDNGDEELDF